MSSGEELLVTFSTHVAGSVHSHVRLTVESCGQTLTADLTLEAACVRMPSRPVMTQTGPSLETPQAVLTPELGLSVDNVDVRMKTGAAQDLLVASSHWTEKTVLRGIEMFQFIMFLQHRVEIICAEPTHSTGQNSDGFLEVNVGFA